MKKVLQIIFLIEFAGLAIGLVIISPTIFSTVLPAIGFFYLLFDKILPYKGGNGYLIYLSKVLLSKYISLVGLNIVVAIALFYVSRGLINKYLDKTISIDGIVIESTYRPIPHCPIWVEEKGKTIHSISTDLDGKFHLNVNPGTIIRCRYQGIEQRVYVDTLHSSPHITFSFQSSLPLDVVYYDLREDLFNFFFNETYAKEYDQVLRRNDFIVKNKVWERGRNLLERFGVWGSYSQNGQDNLSYNLVVKNEWGTKVIDVLKDVDSKYLVDSMPDILRLPYYSYELLWPEENKLISEKKKRGDGAPVLTDSEILDCILPEIKESKMRFCFKAVAGYSNSGKLPLDGLYLESFLDSHTIGKVLNSNNERAHTFFKFLFEKGIPNDFLKYEANFKWRDGECVYFEVPSKSFHMPEIFARVLVLENNTPSAFSDSELLMDFAEVVGLEELSEWEKHSIQTERTFLPRLNVGDRIIVPVGIYFAHKEYNNVQDLVCSYFDSLIIDAQKTIYFSSEDLGLNCCGHVNERLYGVHESLPPKLFVFGDFISNFQIMHKGEYYPVRKHADRSALGYYGLYELGVGSCPTLYSIDENGIKVNEGHIIDSNIGLLEKKLDTNYIAREAVSIELLEEDFEISHLDFVQIEYEDKPNQWKKMEVDSYDLMQLDGLTTSLSMGEGIRFPLEKVSYNKRKRVIVSGYFVPFF